MPDLTLVFDLDVAEGLRRVRARRGALGRLRSVRAARDRVSRAGPEGLLGDPRSGARSRRPDRRRPSRGGRRRRRSGRSSPAGSASRRRDLAGRARGLGPASSVSQGAVAALQRAIAQVVPGPCLRLRRVRGRPAPHGDGLRPGGLFPEDGCGTCATCRRVAADRRHLSRLPRAQPTPPRDDAKGLPTIRIEQVRELERAQALAPFEGPPEGVHPGRRRAHDPADRAGPPQDARGAAAPDASRPDPPEPAGPAADGPLALSARAVRPSRRPRGGGAPREPWRPGRRQRAARASRAGPAGPGTRARPRRAPGSPGGGACPRGGTARRVSAPRSTPCPSTA